MYDAGVPLRWIFLFFFAFAITSILVFTFILPPHTITTERLELLCKDAVLEMPRETRKKSNNDEPLIEPENPRVNGEVKVPEQNREGKQDYRDLQEAPLCEEESDLVDDFVKGDPEVVSK